MLCHPDVYFSRGTAHRECAGRPDFGIASSRGELLCVSLFNIQKHLTPDTRTLMQSLWKWLLVIDA